MESVTAANGVQDTSDAQLWRCIAALDGSANAVCDANGVFRRYGIDLYNAGGFYMPLAAQDVLGKGGT